MWCGVLVGAYRHEAQARALVRRKVAGAAGPTIAGDELGLRRVVAWRAGVAAVVAGAGVVVLACDLWRVEGLICEEWFDVRGG